ncbi:hypothetical protein U3653_04555 [Nocardia sp. CDC186]|uniref:Uncharacterized protein n=1 Tax=Nocardia implantans TaxID=3108168 RepID=A0ABU6AP82_9NOCA|nr:MULTISPECIES: hypothetical protein [unclassified Nocardia]MBF6189634.1 hypothetical protein [Nocardia beijingensis]MEA3527138.1 hypothetical protein [Nocardia sp. CDC192]MEB3509284.1 hypothetical protein [Nocardia sp. CDC186]
MRSLMGLRKRAHVTQPATETTRPLSTEPGVDPPIVAALVEPLLTLRSSLGTGVGVPSAAATGALSAASTQAADTEGPHREGLHALESTWTSKAADSAVPAMRTTQTQIGDISDRGPAYLSVLADAHATSGRAARRVDQIIADFRRDAREILDNATSAPETDAVITRATQALRDALTTVTAARTEMDDHTRRLDEMGPLTVTTPSGVSQGQAVSPGSTGQVVPGTTAPATTQPMDPAMVAQLQLQQQLISAGVDLGTTAINAGVDIGTHIIDKIAEVGIHGIDTVAAAADKAIPELINPGSTTNPGSNGDDSKNSSKLFDFGGSPEHKPSTSGPGSVIPPGNSAPAARADVPKPESRPAPAVIPPADSAPPAPASNPDHPAHPGPTGGMVVPPAAPPGGEDHEHKPRDGQLGVTIPSAVTAVVPVLGEFDDDAP